MKKGQKMLVACRVTEKGFEPVFDENHIPIIASLREALMIKIEGRMKGLSFQPVEDIFDFEEIEIKGLKKGN